MNAQADLNHLPEIECTSWCFFFSCLRGRVNKYPAYLFAFEIDLFLAISKELNNSGSFALTHSLAAAFTSPSD